MVVLPKIKFKIFNCQALICCWEDEDSPRNEDDTSNGNTTKEDPKNIEDLSKGKMIVMVQNKQFPGFKSFFASEDILSLTFVGLKTSTNKGNQSRTKSNKVLQSQTEFIKAKQSQTKSNKVKQSLTKSKQSSTKSTKD